MSEKFHDIVEALAVSGWHAQFRSSQLQLASTGEFDVLTIGRNAWMALPDSVARADALDDLFVSYWQKCNDHDIRNDLDADDELGAETAPMHDAINAARRAGETTVVVDVRHLARVLEQFDCLRLGAVHDRRAAEAQADEPHDHGRQHP